jgi:hypothetical protein
MNNVCTSGDTVSFGAVPRPLTDSVHFFERGFLDNSTIYTKIGHIAPIIQAELKAAIWRGS